MILGPVQHYREERQLRLVGPVVDEVQSHVVAGGGPHLPEKALQELPPGEDGLLGCQTGAQ